MNQTHLRHSTSGFAALEREGAIVPFSFDRRAVRSHDVAVRVLYCGICHSDLHAVNSSETQFPLVPGHEFVGVVTEVGSAVSQFSVGDKVLIGTIVDSCRVCEPCKAEMEVYCREALKLDATLCSLGIPDSLDFRPVLLTMGRRNLSSSGSGGTRETREMLEFCSKHNIVADVEVIAPTAINEAFERLEKGDVHYRFVIDMSTSQEPIHKRGDSLNLRK